MTAGASLSALIQNARERGPEYAAKARERARAVGHPTAPLTPTQAVARLPLWAEPVRAVPNGFLRSALFAAIGKGKRRYMEREQIAALGGLEIRYTGQQLDQGDLDVYESVLHAVRHMLLGSQCRITAYALLKLMGKTDTGMNRETLHTRIARLTANAVEVRQGRHVYLGGLIDEAFKDDLSQEWVIVLNPKLLSLFARDQFTQVQWATRRAMDGKSLAQWLHGFYASHAKPVPVSIEVLLKLSGGKNTNPYSAHQKLRKALDAVGEASAAHGEWFGYEIKDGLVHVKKKAQRSQLRHLAKKAAKARKLRG
ncbi:MAG: plasmid replication initiator TrfA [Thiomonas sp.]|uniref:plasmid replication initiator TrfA n=1 Tax=Thiomonas sp. TaxID=2047785 RepID=UPI002A367BE3|nr:plasmid replication initiator TrfA [Thiomonas sp.]MDY0331809.1 plasmid replication initiator TrfA [Thiomonas sp.]